jgi:hypothetical protein
MKVLTVLQCGLEPVGLIGQLAEGVSFIVARQR